jgi:hypothetical protein
MNTNITDLQRIKNAFADLRRSGFRAYMRGTQPALSQAAGSDSRGVVFLDRKHARANFERCDGEPGCWGGSEGFPDRRAAFMNEQAQNEIHVYFWSTNAQEDELGFDTPEMRELLQAHGFAVATALMRHGVMIEWNGSSEQAITIKPRPTHRRGCGTYLPNGECWKEAEYKAKRAAYATNHNC